MENISNFFKKLVQRKPKFEVKQSRPSNPFNEIQLLVDHEDIVRSLLKVDDVRFISSSDDAKIILWDSETAEIIFVLLGHTKPVTCFLLLENDVLVSGSVDRSLRFWDLTGGKCIKYIPNCHESAVKSLVSISKGRFCSGGNDRYLCIWTNDGEPVGKIERQEEENLHCLLAISNGSRVVTGSNSSLLRVYSTETMMFEKLFTHHRESVRCLVRVNDDFFVSASLDGAVIVWRKDLTPLRLNYPENFKSELKRYADSVNHLLVVQQQYVVACIGNGFQIYNVFTGEKVLDCPSAHTSNVNCIISVGHGSQFLTCSADAQIKLWECSKNFRETAEAASTADNDRFQSRSKECFSYQCLGEMWGHSDQVSTLLKLSETSFVSGGHDNLIIIWRDGEEQSLQRNRDAVLTLMMSEEALLTQNSPSPNSDKSLDISTDRDESEEYSNEDPPIFSASSLGTSKGRTVSLGQAENSRPTDYNVTHSDSEAVSIEPEKHSRTTSRVSRLGLSFEVNVESPKKLDAMSSSSSFEFIEPSSIEHPPMTPPSSSSSLLKITELFQDDPPPPLPPLENEPSNQPVLLLVETNAHHDCTEMKAKRQIRVPFYIFEFAENLLKEENLSEDQIKENLTKQQGHSLALVDAVMRKLKQNDT